MIFGHTSNCPKRAALFRLQFTYPIIFISIFLTKRYRGVLLINCLPVAFNPNFRRFTFEGLRQSPSNLTSHLGKYQKRQDWKSSSNSIQ